MATHSQPLMRFLKSRTDVSTICPLILPLASILPDKRFPISSLQHHFFPSFRWQSGFLPNKSSTSPFSSCSPHQLPFLPFNIAIFASASFSSLQPYFLHLGLTSSRPPQFLRVNLIVDSTITIFASTSITSRRLHNSDCNPPSPPRF